MTQAEKDKWRRDFESLDIDLLFAGMAFQEHVRKEQGHEGPKPVDLPPELAAAMETHMKALEKVFQEHPLMPPHRRYTTAQLKSILRHHRRTRRLGETQTGTVVRR